MYKCDLLFFTIVGMIYSPCNQVAEGYIFSMMELFNFKPFLTEPDGLYCKTLIEAEG